MCSGELKTLLTATMLEQNCESLMLTREIQYITFFRQITVFFAVQKQNWRTDKGEDLTAKTM